RPLRRGGASAARAVFGGRAERGAGGHEGSGPRLMAGKLIAENRRARFDYFLEQTFEAGISLTGSEVKSLRNGKANIAESYAAVENNEIVLINADIPAYTQAR